jgi:trimethylamine--corrinoid protein Co-methyltransferase
MSEERRSGGRRGKAARGGSGLAQLPWRSVENPYPPMEMAGPKAMQALHDTAIRILRDPGIRVMGDRVMALFEGAGAIVDRDTGVVRIDESIVTAALATAPQRFTLTARAPAKRLTFGGRSLHFGLVAGPPNVHDRVRGRRSGSLADYHDFIRLAHHFNAIHMIGNQVTAPQDLAANNRHLDT